MSASTTATPPAAVPDAPVERIGGQIYREPDGTQFSANLKNLVKVLTDANASGVLRIARDTFQDLTLIGSGAGHWTPPGRLQYGSFSWRPMENIDFDELRIFFEEKGFKPVPHDILATAVGAIANRNRFDSALQYCDGLKWDNAPRIDTVMSRYYGTEDTPYTRAVGAYLFTALAGRAIEPGCQADMAVILVGVQGARKTSAVRALSPFPWAFAEVDLSKRDDELARLMRGKLVVELAELQGLTGRNTESTKAWISRQVEEWVPKYKELSTSYPRRCVVVGTSNPSEILDDETGERRWLPVTAGVADVEAIQRDRDQLWAEGKTRFYDHGIEWQAAETLAREQHGRYKVHDDWHGPVVEWLAALPSPRFGLPPPPVPNGAAPFTTLDLLEGALRIAPRDVSVRETRRVGKVLRSIGYSPVTIGSGTGSLRRWIKVAGDA